MRITLQELLAALVLLACVGAGSARADDAATTPSPSTSTLLVVVESSDVAVGAAAVRNALGARLGRPVASLLDETAARAELTLTIAVDRERRHALVRLTGRGAPRATERTVGLPRPPAAAVTAIADVCAALLSELGSEPDPLGRIVRDVRDPFATLPPAPAPREEVINPWPGGFTPHATRPPLAAWPAGPEPRTTTTSTTPPPAIETASALSAPEPGFADTGEP